MLVRAALIASLAALALPAVAVARVDVRSVSASPSRVQVGDTLTVRATAANPGPRAARATRTTFLLSRDRKASIGDVELSTRAVRPLAARGRRSAKTTVAVPDIVAPGRWHLLACVSERRGAAKAKRRCRAAARRVTVLPTVNVKRPVRADGLDDGPEDDAADLGVTAPGTPNLPVASIAPADPVAEADGAALTFAIALSRPAGKPVSVGWSTVDGTATAPADYAARTGTVTFAAGQTTATVAVPLQADDAYELEEALTVALGAPDGVALGAAAAATGTIVDDDVPPLVGVDGTTVAEGDHAVSLAYFTVSLDAAAGTPLSFVLATAADTATAGVDFEPTSITLTIPAGQRVASFVVPVRGDVLAEGAERFGVTIDGQLAAYGHIADDD